MNKPYSKIYILVRDSLDVGHAVNCAAHASLSMYLRHQDKPIVQDWATNSFRKVSCKVSDKQFEKAKTYGDYELITEEHLEQPETVLVFLPRYEWPEFFKSLSLYK